MLRADPKTMLTFEFQPRKVGGGGLKRLSPDPSSYSRQRRNIPTPPAAPTVPDSPTPTWSMDRPVTDSDNAMDDGGIGYVCDKKQRLLCYVVTFDIKDYSV